MKNDARVTFRWPQTEAEHHEHFLQLADEKNLNASELARELIKDAMSERREVAEELATLRDAIEGLRQTVDASTSEPPNGPSVGSESQEAYQQRTEDAIHKIASGLDNIASQLAESRRQADQERAQRRAMAELMTRLVESSRVTQSRVAGLATGPDASLDTGRTMRAILAVLERLIDEQRATHNLFCEVCDLPRHRMKRRDGGATRRVAANRHK